MAGFDLCAFRDGWDSDSKYARFQQTKDWIEATADDWGIDEPDVVRAPPPGHPERRAAYDPATDTLYLNPDLFEDGRDVDDALDSAGHELRHAHQYAVYDEYGDWGDTDFDQALREEDADAFGEAFMDAVEDACDDEGAESAPGDLSPADRAREERGEPASPAGDWNLPPEGVRYV